MSDDTKPSAGLPVKGYKPVQPQWAIDAVNRIKVVEEKLLRELDDLATRGSAVDQRWVAIARTQVQQGCMGARRAVFQPQRLEGDLD